MASYITYTQGANFSYNSQTYQHSLNLQFTNYKLDKFGRKVSGGNDDLQVRSYYKVDGVDSGAFRIQSMLHEGVGDACVEGGL